MVRRKHTEAIGNKRKRGKPPLGSRPSKAVLQRLYEREGRSIREISGLLQCSKDMIARSLKESGIERRPHTWSPKLERFDLDFIRETVRQKGYRNGAKEFGVDKSTLYRYLKRMAK